MSVECADNALGAKKNAEALTMYHDISLVYSFTPRLGLGVF